MVLTWKTVKKRRQQTWTDKNAIGVWSNESEWTRAESRSRQGESQVVVYWVVDVTDLSSEMSSLVGEQTGAQRRPVTLEVTETWLKVLFASNVPMLNSVQATAMEFLLGIFAQWAPRGSVRRKHLKFVWL